MTLEIMANHTLSFWMTTEDLPDPNNRVTRRPRTAASCSSYTPNNEEAHQRLHREAQGHAEGDRLPRPPDATAGVHSRHASRSPAWRIRTAPCRFGRDPKTSALDVNCKAHDLDNLYVVDGSFFPSSGAVNPALTIMANALRVGDHLLERLG